MMYGIKLALLELKITSSALLTYNLNKVIDGFTAGTVKGEHLT